MTTKKVTKKALFMSAVSVLLSVSMLVGSTYAWFTDSVTSAGNIIKSGTLQVSMEWANGTENPDIADTVWTDASEGAIFNYDLWEPGYTDVRHLRIANEGTLALKYKLRIMANGEVSALADVIDVYFIDPAEQIATREALSDKTPAGTLSETLASADATAAGSLAVGETDTITIALKMQEDAGNAYQDMSIGTDFSVQLLAIQDTVEEDAFDDQYDANADETPDNAGWPFAVTTASATVSGNAANFNASVAPADNKTTAVAITGLDDVNDDDTLTLDVKTDGFADAQDKFTVEDDHTAIAGIDLTLTDAQGAQVTFDEGTATVTTYILPGLDPANVTVKYNGEGSQPTDVTYNAETGMLTFKTTHFSEYYVDYEGSFTYIGVLGRAFTDDDDLFDAMYKYAESKVTNLDKIDIDALIEFMDEEWFGPYTATKAYANILLAGAQGIRPSYANEDILEYADITSAEALEMQQQYFDAYKACIDSAEFYPAGDGVSGWAPWPMYLPAAYAEF